MLLIAVTLNAIQAMPDAGLANDRRQASLLPR
jgi:hypothetical protein